MDNNAIKAINPSYQRVITKAYKAYREYYRLVDLDGTFCLEKNQEANERKQEKAFDKYTELLADLPAREQTNFDKQHEAIHGYP